MFFETPVVKSKSRAHTTVTAIENKQARYFLMVNEIAEQVRHVDIISSFLLVLIRQTCLGVFKI